MRHPIIKSNKECLTLDAPKESGTTMHDVVADGRADIHTRMEAEEDVASKVKILKKLLTNNVVVRFIVAPNSR